MAASCTPRPELTPAEGGQTGYASWYGARFHGRPTASGEIYDMSALTCAHRTLPFGTSLSVTNLENGRSVTVTVNDRGPFVSGRIVDLSHAAARELAFTEKGLVRVRVVPQGRIEPGGPGRPYFVQAGAFRNRENAVASQIDLLARFTSARPSIVEEEGLFRVRLGPIEGREEAEGLLSELRKEGYEGFVLRP